MAVHQLLLDRGKQIQRHDGQVGYTGGAAKVCNDYTITVNGIIYNDWFLPSKDELNQMYENKADKLQQQQIVVVILSEFYWSSTEYDNVTRGDRFLQW